MSKIAETVLWLRGHVMEPLAINDMARRRYGDDDVPQPVQVCDRIESDTVSEATASVGGAMPMPPIPPPGMLPSPFLPAGPQE